MQGPPVNPAPLISEPSRCGTMVKAYRATSKGTPAAPYHMLYCDHPECDGHAVCYLCGREQWQGHSSTCEIGQRFGPDYRGQAVNPIT